MSDLIRTFPDPAIRNPPDPLRARLGALIEQLIALADALDGDPDLEDSHDSERDDDLV